MEDVQSSPANVTSHSLEELAQHLKLSVGTVSRALNGHQSVSRSTRERVRLAAKATGYTPNPLARGLSGGRSGLVGVLFSHFVNSVTGVFLIQLVKRLEALELRPMIKIGNPLMESNIDIIRDFAVMKVEGVIVLGSHLDSDSPTMQPLTQAGIPYVSLNFGGPPARAQCVQHDRAAAERELVGRLLELGHREFALIGFYMGSYSFISRMEGIKQAFKDHGVTGKALLHQFREVREKDESTFDFGYRMARQLVEQKTKATACLAGNDEIALGAIRYFQSHHIHVPGDISVAGFDNLGFSAHTTPPITTIDLEIDRTLEMVLDLLTRQIAAPQPLPPAPILVRPSVILRESTGRRPRRRGRLKPGKAP